MKKVIILVFPLLLLLSCATEKPVNFDQLQDRSGLFYLVNEEKPFTGEVVKYDAGTMILHGFITDGVKDGVWTEYYQNGQKMTEGKYRNGLKEGTWTIWQDNGQVQGNEEYRSGIRLGKENPDQPSQETQTEPDQPSAQPVQQPAKAPAQSAQTEEKPAAKPKAVEPVKPKPVDWERLRGGPVKYLDGIPYTGPVVKYYREGGKELDGYFTHGKRTGKWTFYDRFGNIKDVRYY